MSRPSAPKPEAIGPQLNRAGPLTMINGAVQCVVDCISVRSNCGCNTACTAANTTGIDQANNPPYSRYRNFLDRGSTVTRPHNTEQQIAIKTGAILIELPARVLE
ncbi:MAG: hypothetical protein CM15mP120_02740 [Pseudomonadota bacterium]|nr:MAG: hypothetical protein CM15mP120_02740 [Pseudomonadota bacterium]